eukprot:512435-Karenia_brevis.AAC.1
MGHIGRNCPSKGLGKGSRPLGKGGPQVGVKGKGKGAGASPPASTGIPAKGAPGNKRGGGVPGMKGKGAPGAVKGYGKGFPFQGFCWKCGGQGHRSFECPNASFIQGGEDGSVTVDSSIKADACSIEI